MRKFAAVLASACVVAYATTAIAQSAGSAETIGQPAPGTTAPAAPQGGQGPSSSASGEGGQKPPAPGVNGQPSAVKAEGKTSKLPPVVVEQKKSTSPPPEVKPVKQPSTPAKVQQAAAAKPAPKEKAPPAAAPEEAAATAAAAGPDDATASSGEFRPGSAISGTGSQARNLNIDYQATTASTATKLSTPILETPAGIQVVPAAIINDRKAVDLKEALATVSGISAIPSGGAYNGFLLRGFESSVLYRNGLRVGMPGMGFGTDFDLANVQSVEVLKGPASVLYGRGEPGGVINLVTKRPESTPHYSVEQQFGSFDYYRTNFDLTGPVTANNSVLYRFTGTYQNNSTFRDFHTSEQFDLAPSVTVRPAEGTLVTFDFEYFKKKYQFDYGVPLPIGATQPDPRIPISRSLQDPNDPRDALSNVYAGVDLKQKLGDYFTFNGKFLYRLSDQSNVDLSPLGLGFCGGTASTLCRTLTDQAYRESSYALSADLIARFKLGDAKNEALVGVDYSIGNGRYRVANYDTSQDLTLDIFNPVYRLPGTVYSDKTNQTFSEFVRVKTENTGVYFQDHITLWNTLHIIGGGRYDWATSGFSNQDANGNFAQSYGEAVAPPASTDTYFSPRIGAVLQVLPGLSVYGSWTDSFGHNNNGSPHRTPGALPPETATQIEAGIKAELFGGKLTATLAAYDLTKHNVATTDPIVLQVGGPPFYVVTVGAVRSRGIEIDLAGHVTDNLGVTGSYAFTDTVVTQGTDGDNFPPFAGTPWPNVPKHQAALWLKYDFAGYEAKEGLSLGFGVRYIGERQGSEFQDPINFPGESFVLPAYTVFDASAAYKWKFNPSDGTTWTASLNLKNLLDKNYYASAETLTVFNCSSARICVHPGEPFTVIGSIKVDW